jgi:hypothetical protein
MNFQGGFLINITRKLKNFLNNIPKKYEVFLPKSDSDLLKRKCRTMMVTEEQYIANLVAINVRPEDGGFRIITRGGLLIDSKGKGIDEYMDEKMSN